MPKVFPRPWYLDVFFYDDLTRDKHHIRVNGQSRKREVKIVNPFDTSHRAKIEAKLAKLRVDALMFNCYHVVTSLETVQQPMFACYTLGLPSNMSSVPQLPPGGCSGHSKSKMRS